MFDFSTGCHRRCFDLSALRKLVWFPVRDHTGISIALPVFMAHIILLTLVLGTVCIALSARRTRATILKDLNEDNVRAAYAEILVAPEVLVKHALKDAMVRIGTTVGLEWRWSRHHSPVPRPEHGVLSATRAAANLGCQNDLAAGEPHWRADPAEGRQYHPLEPQ